MRGLMKIRDEPACYIEYEREDQREALTELLRTPAPNDALTPAERSTKVAAPPEQRAVRIALATG